MVEVTVLGLALDDKNQAPVLLLKDETGGVVLPIWIGAMEAVAISVILNNVDFPRPMTHDLLLTSLIQLGGTVEAVEVTRIENGTFYAEVVVRRSGETQRIDSRPSDAVALAVRAKCPIRVAPAVLDQAGTKGGEVGEAVLDSEEAKKWSDELEKMSVDDLKYKM